MCHPVPILTQQRKHIEDNTAFIRFDWFEIFKLFVKNCKDDPSRLSTDNIGKVFILFSNRDTHFTDFIEEFYKSYMSGVV